MKHSLSPFIGYLLPCLFLATACSGNGRQTSSSSIAESSRSAPSSSSIVSSQRSSSSQPLSSSSVTVPSSVASSQSSVVTSSSQPIGGDVGKVFEAEALSQALSSGYQIYSASTGERYAGNIDAGSRLCFENVDLTGVKSLELSIARDNSFVSSVGRVAVLWGSANFDMAENLGEQLTTNTGGWELFRPLSIGLAREVTGRNTLCLRALQGNGVLNLDKFTLSAKSATNAGITDFKAPPPNGPFVEPVTTSGNKVLVGGQPKALAGNSLFWSNGKFSADTFFTAEVVAWLKRDWKAQLVRAPLAVDDTKPNGQTVAQLGGYLTHPDENLLNVKRVVNAAIKEGMYVIIDWHAHKAEDNKAAAITFFQDMARTYGGYNNVIYEIYNEPVNTSWPDIKRYAEEVIAAIRAIDPDNLIIVGTRFYSQEVEEAADNPIINYSNIAYTLHFYAGSHKQSLRDKALRALNKGIPLFVTEWGAVNADGAGAVDENETRAWMQFLKTHNISHANWAISDLNQGSAALKRGASVNGGWSDNDLTASGKLVKGIILAQ